LVHDESTPYNAYLCDTLSRQFFYLINQPISILDFGCGTGLLTFFMQRSFFNATTIGVDTNNLLVQENQKNYPNLRFMSLDDNSLPFENATFDLIYSVNVLHHIPQKDHKQTIRNLVRTLKPSGAMLIFEFNPYNLYMRSVFKQEHTKDFSMIKPHYWSNLLKGESLNIKTTYLYPNFTKTEPYLSKIPFGSLYSVSITNKAE
jgi:ubiquinone/menaquinone biosynthesis C-methylase UbiE